MSNIEFPDDQLDELLDLEAEIAAEAQEEGEDEKVGEKRKRNEHEGEFGGGFVIEEEDGSSAAPVAKSTSKWNEESVLTKDSEKGCRECTYAGTLCITVLYKLLLH